ncbi:hypothetical protein B0H16DRAFT_1891093 [Mycena metata]|uniref:Uncharacterized protein n=1 Tax=Mycena metata TaxID=1033252 RepID=A0AAD7IBL9_9AGAR|nr:hypothetical protein B0H16DRAFT_1891093 [Mycena metata]
MATAFFFGTTWTEKTCVPAVGGALRALSASIVSLIFMWRAWAIWHKRRRILYLLMIAFIPTTVFTWGFVFNQVPEVKNGSCGGLAGTGVFVAKWPFALANIVFDAVCVGLSTYRLALNLKDGSSQISSILLVDGLGYFFTSVALQVLNLIFLLSPDPAKQSTMITFTNAITGLLSQRINEWSPVFDRCFLNHRSASSHLPLSTSHQCPIDERSIPDTRQVALAITLDERTSATWSGSCNREWDRTGQCYDGVCASDAGPSRGYGELVRGY